MTDIILSGAFGKMGRTIAALVAAREDCRICAGLDIGEGEAAFPVYKSPGECTLKADVLIDFSHPSLLTPLLRYLTEKRLPAVLCTTGYTPEQCEEIRTASQTVPIFFSANMSLGVNLLASLCEKAAAVLGHDFDIEIIEKHHNQKVDAPSGTALMLAERISDSLECQNGEKAEYVYDRHAERRKRCKNEIGLHSVRGGTIVGEHEVLFAGTDEVISLSHTAYSKQVFAVGAINAANYLKDEEPGLYDMGDLV